MQILDTIKHLISFIKIFTFPSQLPEPLARNTAFPELKQFITFILLPFFQVGPLCNFLRITFEEHFRPSPVHLKLSPRRNGHCRSFL